MQIYYKVMEQSSTVARDVREWKSTIERNDRTKLYDS